MNSKRTSVYLESRCEIVEQLLAFFEAKNVEPLLKVERAVVFLAQLQFWDWELENLILAINSYRERSTAWTDLNGYGMANALKTAGFWIRKKYLGGLKSRRVQRQVSGQQVSAPVKRLNLLLIRWNNYLDYLEQEVLIDEEERLDAASYHCNIHLNLNAWRKAMLLEDPVATN